MITLIYGVKGSGKTKKIIDAANDAAMKDDGDVVYLTDQPSHSVQIKHTVRFIDFASFNIKSPDAAMGFIKGVLSVNNDIVEVFIDGLSRMANCPIADMEGFYKELERLAVDEKVDFTLTVSCDGKDLPRFMKKYI